MNTQKTKRIVVKVGSSLVTSNGEGLDHAAIGMWAEQMAALLADGHEVLMVSSGAIAEGMQRLGWTKRPTEIHQLQAAAAVGQMGLVQVYESCFARFNLRSAQVLLTNADLADIERNHIDYMDYIECNPTIKIKLFKNYITMCEEIFGPVLTIYVYEPQDFEKTLELVDATSPYALTGAIFSQDRYAIDLAMKKLVNSAGNFYINDKPTGAVVGQQPFGGARASGTNDKAGSILNLYRWVQPRTIKETFVSPTDYKYPFLGEE
jgi:hypothetical protein